jgi:hypothetical protein
MSEAVPPLLHADGAADAELTRDELFGTLSNERRRHVIETLKGRPTGEAVALRDLTEVVACRETGKPPEELTYRERKRVYTALHQRHLLKMNDLGAVEYDRDRGVVAPGARTDEFAPYLEGERDGVARGARVLAVVVASAALQVVGYIDAFPLGGVPDAAIGLGSVAIVGAVAVWAAVSGA